MGFEALWLAQEGWTEEDNKMFEIAITIFDEDTPDRWLNVAALVPGKTVSEVIKHHKKLEHDISEIEAGGFDDTFEHADNHISDACKKLKLETKEWTKEENKKFESALVIYEKDTPDRWLKVAAMVPGKTLSVVIKHYEKLEHDIGEIEAGRVPDSEYSDNHIRDAYRKRLATPVKRRGRRVPLGQKRNTK